MGNKDAEKRLKIAKRRNKRRINLFKKWMFYGVCNGDGHFKRSIFLL